MLRHPPPVTSASAPRLGHLSELVSSRLSAHSAKRPLVTLHAGTRWAKTDCTAPKRLVATRLFTTSRPCLQVKRTPASQSSKKSKTSDATKAKFARSAKSLEDAHESQVPHADQDTTLLQKQQQPSIADLADLSAAVDRVTNAFLAQPGIPSEQTTLTALRACGKSDVKLVLDGQKQESESVAAASHLLDLAGDARKSGDAAAANQASQNLSKRLQNLVDQISDAAYAIITHPAVVITPQVLREYVAIQARLGKPESLPYVLDLYASKPKPQLVSGIIKYVKQNPNRLAAAVDAEIADAALDAAIEAKHLDAAIGIVESTYATKASIRNKLVKKALLPATVFGVTPMAAYILATRLSDLQQSMDSATATKVAFVGILAYVGFTATIGLVAASTANDQMKRVTWAIGTPLSQRWLREEERAAIDKVVCAFGFKEEKRYGEEEGETFQLLREFILGKGMILDAVDLMPGMN